MRALPGMSDEKIDSLFKQREEVRNAPVAPGALGAAGGNFQITAEVSVDGAHVVRVCVVQFTGDAAKPYLIMAWR